MPHLLEVNKKLELEFSMLEERSHKMLFSHFPNNFLGKGSYGTIVYEGKFEDCRIAIKKIYKMSSDDFYREISILMKIRYHSNIVYYYGSQQDDNFYYIGLELCECSLDKLIFDMKYASLKEKFSDEDLLNQMTNGVQFLHLLDIGKLI